MNKKLLMTFSLLGIGILFLECTKKKDDNNGATALALGLATVVPETGPGCDRTQKKCVVSLLAGKTWYMVGSEQQPKNLLGFQEAVVNASTCFYATRAEIASGSGDGDLTFTVSNRIADPPSCTRNAPSGDYGTPTVSTFNVITPVSKDCFNIEIYYGTIKQIGRGFVNSDGTLFKLEAYRTDNADPAGYTCEEGNVGDRNATLTPDTTSCNSAFYVCTPSSDSTYNNVQVYDLVE